MGIREINIAHMKAFFNVMDLDRVFEFVPEFPVVDTETVLIEDARKRIIAEDVVSDVNLPDFPRSTMDGYAVRGSSTFGASEANPTYLTLTGTVEMGTQPDLSVGPGEAVRISTGGMLPSGSDSVVMVEHAEAIDDVTLEVYRSVAPGQNAIGAGEDFKTGEVIITKGQRLRPQEIGLLAAFGREEITIYRKPVVSIISTGDEIVPINQAPEMAQIRDINTYTLLSAIQKAGGIPKPLGIVKDDYDSLFSTCARAQAESDMVLISGGSSVGARDFTIAALSDLPEAAILIHGIAISPGKPTILARSLGKALWGLPGHVVSAMVVFEVVVRPFVEQMSGLAKSPAADFRQSARLSRNLSSNQGRVDFIRVRLVEKNGECWAEPVLGKSGLINTMVKADGLIKIPQNTEGLDRGTPVEVMPI